MSPVALALATSPSRTRDVAPAVVLERLKQALPAMTARAAVLDQQPSFPVEDIALLRQIGALEVFAGDQPTPLELMEALRLVGRAHLSVGRLFEGHINGAKLMGWYGDDLQKRRLADDLEKGVLYGVWNTEPTPGARIIRGGKGPILAGHKCFASGAGYVDRAVVTATESSGARRMIVIDGADVARAEASGWKVRGMKATVSGFYNLSGIPVTPDALLGEAGDYEREPRFSAGAWRFTAVQLGGAERILGLIRDHLIASPSGVHMVQRARFASAVAAVRSAWLWVREAAQRAEAPGAGPDEIALVLMTRGVVERAGLDVMEAAARLVGTRAFFVECPLDLACRDLALYLRQPGPDKALDRAAEAFLERDAWSDDRLW
jgi:alkylation response protein AidB-like acyl-CoA dehydrogenase